MYGCPIRGSFSLLAKRDTAQIRPIVTRTCHFFGGPTSASLSGLTTPNDSALLGSVNENSTTVRLRDFMASDEGWGRNQGREVYPKLIEFVEDHPGVMIFKVSLQDVRRGDISFASETVVEASRR